MLTTPQKTSDSLVKEGDYIPYEPPTLKNLLDKTIRKYIEIEDAEDINMNRPSEIIVNSFKGGKRFYKDENLNKTNMERLAVELATHEEINFQNTEYPLSTKLPDGSRIEIWMGSCVVSGFGLSIRKRKKGYYGLKDFGLDDQQIEFLKECVQNRRTLLVSGGTSSGKTTVLECLIDFIEDDRRLITIQDPIELDFKQPDVYGLSLNATNEEERQQKLQFASSHAMRMNPDSIVIGEIRAKELAHCFLQMSNTGHDGSMTTIHANNSEYALTRLASLCQQFMGGDRRHIREELEHTIEIGVHVSKTRDKRRVAKITTFDSNG